MDASNRDLVAHALELAIEGLSPFVIGTLEPLLPASVTWTDLLEERDRSNGIRNKTYSPRGLQGLLRVLTERLGTLGFPFSNRMPRPAQNLASELRDVRNRWAHHEAFSDDDTHRALDTTERLLRAVGADALADDLEAIRRDFRPVSPAAEVPSPVAAPTTVPTAPLASDIVPPPSGVSISLDAVPVLSYAAAHNQLAFVDSVEVHNSGPARRGALLRIEASSALGVLSRPFEQYLDLAADQTLTVTNPRVLLDPATMLLTEERRPGEVRATVEFDGATLASARVSVDLLAAHQWVRNPPNLSLELLAAFVQPNHPAINKLLTEASDILIARTGSGSLEGYQSDDIRVDQIAEAIFFAMQRRNIRYSNPPASWGEDGQKIRTPSEVLDGRVGTCLDTTVVMAAALEQAGIRPLLWVVDGHAFVGYWRVEGSMGSGASIEVMDAVNQVDLGNIAVIESTLVTERAEPATFADALTQPRREHLVGRPDRILGITDVVEARQSRIFPLPARVVKDDGTITVTEYHPAASIAALREEAFRLPSEREGRDPEPARVAQWKNALLDLTLRNRLINFADSARLTLAVPEADVSFLEDSINDGKQLTLLPSNGLGEVLAARGVHSGRELPDAQRTALLRDKWQVHSDVTDAAYDTKFRKLAYAAKTIEEESGANNLYLAFGSLIWEFKNRVLRSPLVLVPVKIEGGRGGRIKLVLDESGTSTPNYCLLEKLRQSIGLTIPGLADPTDDGSGIDLDKAFRDTRQAIAVARLPFRVEPTVDLAVLQFAKFRLWKDLDDNWAEFTNNALVRHLVHTPTEQFVEPVADSKLVDLEELGALSPVAADSSQLRAVAQAVAGRTFVLEGPPGTGKSQTITNLLARAIADGKRVLFVAEKRAALEVVQRRLDEIGLGAFTLNLHDKGSRPNMVRAQIKAALNHRVSSDPDGLRAATETLNSSRRALARYAERMHKANGAGLSFYSARVRQLAALESIPTMEVPESIASTDDPELVDELRRLFRALPDIADPARPQPNHPWAILDGMYSDGIPADGIHAGRIHAVDQRAVTAAAARVDAALQSLADDRGLAPMLAAVPSIASIDRLVELTRAPKITIGDIDTARSPEWQAQVGHALSDLAAFRARATTELAGVNPHILGLDLEAVHSAAVAADTSAFFGRKKRRLAALESVLPYLAEPVTIRAAQISALTGRLAAMGVALSTLRAGFDALDGLHQAADWNPLLEPTDTRIDYQITWLQWLSSALNPVSVIGAEDSAALRTYYCDASQDADAAGQLRELADAFRSLDTATSGSVERWGGGAGFTTRWTQSAAERAPLTTGPAMLAHWIALLDHLRPLAEHGLILARNQVLDGNLLSEDALAAFEKGLAAASLKERGKATTLNTFHPQAHEQAILRFTAAADHVRAGLVTEIPAALLANRTFDSRAVNGMMGGLARQLDRQRGGMGIRSLLKYYGPLISRLVPCMLMSPESVARFFSAEGDLFDIVVFDEASQVRVADAIGAMGRGRSVVVVGDSKQMPPSSFGEAISSADEIDRDDSGIVQDEESILSECVTAQVSPLALTWHYRSQDETLISFSNEHYYGNLSSFPSPLHGKTDDGLAGHGISLVRLNGEFLRNAPGKAKRTNPVEAAAIVNEIQQRFWASPDRVPSLGVVTFNAEQRTLIDSLLRDTGDTRIVESLEPGAEGLFVKNLANVQGDERDVILFSTAFSANSQGVLPLNFGPLSQGGGERRLNVAITRARRQIIVFSSFDAADIRSSDTTSTGLKHLRAYLEFAAKSASHTPTTRTHDQTVDRHREEIASALRLRGLVVTTDVGLSDFRIDLSLAVPEAPDSPLVAVLLDSPAWASRRTVADRDGLPVDVLRGAMKWPAVERVWMPAWLDDREVIVDSLVRVAQSAHSKASDTPALPLRPARPSNESAPDQIPHDIVQPVSSSAIRSTLRPSHPPTIPWTDSIGPEFRGWRPRQSLPLSVLDDLPSVGATQAVTTLLRAVVEFEGPVHTARLAKLVAGAFGLGRVAQSRVTSILDTIPVDLHAGRDGAFIWPSTIDRPTWTVARRTPDASLRPLDHVHPVEIGNAMAMLCVNSAGLYETELLRAAMQFFGVSRLTANVEAMLRAALDQAVATERLVVTAEGIFRSIEVLRER